MSKARDLSDFISTASVDATEIADGAITTAKVSDANITHAKLHTDMNFTGKTLTLSDDHLSGNKIHGGVISNFASTGIDDNASSTAVTINSSNNVGIGESSPDVALHVHDGSGAMIESPGAQAYLYMYANDRANNYDRRYIATENSGDFTIAGFGTGQWQKHLVIDSGGRVGIGTSSPTAGLHVENANGIIASRSGYSQYLQLQPANNNIPTILGVGGNGVHLGPTNSTGIRVDNSGNVGIGTNSPLYQLDVGDGSGSNSINIYSGSSDTSAVYFTDNTSGTGSYVGRIGYAHNHDSMLFTTNTTEQMRIDSNGRLGIKTGGTVTDIPGTSHDTVVIGEGSSTSRGAFIHSTNNMTFGFYDGFGSYPAARVLWDVNDDQLRFYTRNSGGTGENYHMVVDNNGNIGIGTSSPGARLDVRGSIDVDKDGTGTVYVTKKFTTTHIADNRTKHIAFGLQDGSFGGMICRNGVGSNTSFNSQHIEFHVHNGAIFAGEVMRINYDKHVGIQTTSPERNLHVVGSGTGDFEMRIGAGGSLSQNATLDVVATHDSHIFQCWDDNNLTTPKFVVERAGDVGIGQQNPAHKLHVSGNVKANTFIHRTGNNGGVGANETEAIYFGGSSAVFHDNVNLSSAGQAIFRMGGSRAELMRMRNNSGYAIYAENGSITSASDHRIKTDVTEIPNAWEKVKQINPIEYRHTDEWDSENTNKRLTGFIAHELQELIPAAVGGVKDEVDEDGDPVMQGVDYGRVTPLLAAALKQALIRIEELETRLDNAGL